MTNVIGIHKVSAYLAVEGAAEAIEFYKKAFGAALGTRMEEPDGRIGYAELTIGETVVMISDAWPDMRVLSPLSLNGNSVSLVVEVEDADAAWGRALGAGASIERPLKDEPYGRTGWVVDPYGHRWCINAPIQG
ncbi:MAG: VOC family protein [Dehalococcoidia bacterium]